MKILLQSAQTKLYFCLLDMWVKDASAAFDFRHSQRALDFVRQQNLRDVQLVVKFEDAEWEEVVPLPLPIAMLAPRLASSRA